jgi:hypothetical protein
VWGKVNSHPGEAGSDIYIYHGPTLRPKKFSSSLPLNQLGNDKSSVFHNGLIQFTNMAGRSGHYDHHSASLGHSSPVGSGEKPQIDEQEVGQDASVGISESIIFFDLL